MEGSGRRALGRRIHWMTQVLEIKELVNSYIVVLDPKKGDIGLENTHNLAFSP
jgi:hypothetical protein